MVEPVLGELDRQTVLRQRRGERLPPVVGGVAHVVELRALGLELGAQRLVGGGDAALLALGHVALPGVAGHEGDGGGLLDGRLALRAASRGVEREAELARLGDDGLAADGGALILGHG